MPKDKSNPFKLWGSYIGGLASFFIFPFCKQGFLSNCQAARDTFLNTVIQNTFGNLIPVLEVFIGIFGLGFLIGWGIHALILTLND
ncbi:MAG: hypothetical protein ACE5ES_00945 [Candidatus Nanoarchaeia archaeon]